MIGRQDVAIAERRLTLAACLKLPDVDLTGRDLFETPRLD